MILVPFLNDKSLEVHSRFACTYAAVCITNDLDCSVNYAYRWGNGAWESVSLSAHISNTHTYTYPGASPSSPDFFVRFDRDLSNGQLYKDYCLERYQSWTRDCCDARKFAFQKPNLASDYFDLYSLPDSL